MEFVDEDDTTGSRQEPKELFLRLTEKTQVLRVFQIEEGRRDFPTIEISFESLQEVGFAYLPGSEQDRYLTRFDFR